MPNNIPSLKPKELIRILESAGCKYLSEGKGDHTLYCIYRKGKKRVVPIDMGDKRVISTLCFAYFQAVWFF